eukprot:3208492-Pleurochrysis_carterae.AAC.2
MPGAQRPLAVGVDGDVDGVVDGNNDADGGDAKASAGFLDALFSAFSGTSSAAEGADAGKSLAQSAIADSLAADSGAEGDAEGARSPLKMLIFMSGSGYGGAVRLVARGGKGWEGKTQQLFVRAARARGCERMHACTRANVLADGSCAQTRSHLCAYVRTDTRTHSSAYLPACTFKRMHLHARACAHVPSERPPLCVVASTWHRCPGVLPYVFFREGPLSSTLHNPANTKDCE